MPLSNLLRLSAFISLPFLSLPVFSHHFPSLFISLSPSGSVSILLPPPSLALSHLATLSPEPARPGPTHRRRRPRRGAGRARPARRAGAAWCRLPAATLPGIAPVRPGGNARSPSQNSWAAPGFLAQTNPPPPEAPPHPARSPETLRAEGGHASLGRLPGKGPPWRPRYEPILQTGQLTLREQCLPPVTHSYGTAPLTARSVKAFL